MWRDIVNAIVKWVQRLDDNLNDRFNVDNLLEQYKRVFLQGEYRGFFYYEEAAYLAGEFAIPGVFFIKGEKYNFGLIKEKIIEHNFNGEGGSKNANK